MSEIILSASLAAVRLVLCGVMAAGFSTAGGGHVHADDDIPNLVGTWKGENRTISDKKGLRSWSKTVVISEQTDRRFRGHFTYSAGTKHFFGVVFPDNKSFSWVASDSKGYNLGRILGHDRISACYVESWEEATAGCADMVRQAGTQ